jgi:starch synthase
MVRASEAFRFKDQWRELQRRAMGQNFSWENSAKEYIQLYNNVMDGYGGVSNEPAPEPAPPQPPPPTPGVVV